MGPKLWWGGTRIRTLDPLLESQECNHCATGGRPRFFSSFFYLYFGGTVLTSRPPGGGVPVAGADLAGPTNWPGGGAGAMVAVTNSRQSNKKEPEDIFFSCWIWVASWRPRWRLSEGSDSIGVVGIFCKKKMGGGEAGKDV